MELLTQKLVFIALLAAMFPLTLNGQNYEKKVAAFQQSYIHEASGDYTQAIENLKSVYQEDGYEVNLRLGYICYLAGRFTESLAYYSKAVDLMPYAIEPRLGYVLPAAAIGNYSIVLNQYNKILEITPNNSIILHRIGLIYYGREDYTGAEKYFEKVVNLYPFDYEALTMLAWTKYRLNKLREAKVLFYKALLNTPSGSSAAEGLELLSAGN